MYESDLNIKHNSRSEIYWGIEKDTGKAVRIGSVQRGLQCNCRCAVCNGDLIARQGEKNRYHFAHKNNYDCVYANEVAVYWDIRDFLQTCNQINTPAISVKINSLNVDVARPAKDSTVGNVYYQCDKDQYPPLLVADLDGRPTRLVLNFNGYFKLDDLNSLELEAKVKDWDCLMVNLPGVNAEDTAYLSKVRSIVKSGSGSSWVYSSLSSRWLQRLDSLAKVPPKAFPELDLDIYDCPLHRRQIRGKFVACQSDCQSCQFQFGRHPVKCLAYEGILRLKDVKNPEEGLAYVDSMRKDNDMILALSSRHAPAAVPSQQNKNISASELQQIAHDIETYPNEPACDRFGKRWFKCTSCGEIIPEVDTVDYGGSLYLATEGRCRECGKIRRFI